MKIELIKKLKWLFVILSGTTISALGQTQTKQYKESFSVDKDITIVINTNYTDVEFETWDKDVVAVEARIEVEGISEEEAEAYFKDWNFEAMGNSKKVRITARSGFGSDLYSFYYKHEGEPIFPSAEMHSNFDYTFPKMKYIDSMVVNLKEIPMPSFDNLSEFSFDYEAYKEDGEAYLEQWKKEFNENFDKNFKPKFEVWKKELESHRKDMEKHKEEMKKHRESASKIRKKAKEEHKKAVEKMRKDIQKSRGANTFFYRSNAKDKSIKIKKTIKIKMPKGAKLKMDVRHGEVKLAENFKNIKATLSHTRLLAAKVDGEHTNIEVSYAPVLVDYWNKGKLKVNYVKDVAIKHIKSVNLSSTSSNVHIGNIAEDAIIKGNFGKLEIENIENNFDQIDVVLDNTDAIIALPKSAFDFYCDTTSSKVNIPEQLHVNVSKNYYGQLTKGYHKQKNSSKNINVTAIYSDVIIR